MDLGTLISMFTQANQSQSANQSRSRSDSKGIGYGGTEMDAQILKFATYERYRRRQLYDEQLTIILRKLNYLLYQITHPSGSSSGSDNAIDHPLLLPMLLGPGYADGMALAAPFAVAIETIKIPATSGNKKKRSLSATDPSPPSTVTYVPDSRKCFNNSIGDGVHGGSVLYTVFSEFLRTSLMDLTTDNLRRNVFSFVLQALSSIGKHMQLAPALLYTPSDEITSVIDNSQSSTTLSSSSSATRSSSSKSSSRSKNASTATTSAAVHANDRSFPLLPVSPYATWYWGEKYWDKNGELDCPDASIITLFTKISYQANIFINRMNSSSGPNDQLLCGSEQENKEFSAVLDLSNEIHQSYSITHTGVITWFKEATNMLDCLPDDWDPVLPDPIVTSSSSSSTSSSTSATTFTGISTRSRRRGKAMDSTVNASTSTVLGLADSPTLYDPMNDRTPPIGRTSIDYKPSSTIERSYKELFQDEAYVTVPNLKDQHTYRNGIPSGTTHSYLSSSTKSSASGSSTGSSMKRHMKVSVELASMTSLAVSWGSSIVIHTDESSMNLLRSIITGPADTPYMNGCWFFDIGLPNDYPNIPPSVKFLTTGQGTVRMNPNLYADGKVCLSLLGTWSGPSWSPDSSTLSQVLMSIQAQILVDVPYINEPGYESSLNTTNGRKIIAMYNMHARLATLRYAMYDVLRSIPSGFERVVKGHFFYKRDEIKVQVEQWIKEIHEIVLYEEYLYLRALMGYTLCEVLAENKVILLNEERTVSNYINEYARCLQDSNVINIFTNNVIANRDAMNTVQSYLNETFHTSKLSTSLGPLMDQLANSVATVLKIKSTKVYAQASGLYSQSNATVAATHSIDSHGTFVSNIVDHLYSPLPAESTTTSSSSSSSNTSATTSSASPYNTTARLRDPKVLRNQYKRNRPIDIAASMIEVKTLLYLELDKLTEHDLVEEENDEE